MFKPMFTLAAMTVFTFAGANVAQAACAYYNDNSNTITGTGNADCIYAGGGDDTVTTNGGADDVWGEDGDDDIFGKDGDDDLRGGTGCDLIEGGDGNDEIWGGPDTDYLYGNTYADTLYGGDGDDFLYGGDGDDTLQGGEGADYMSGMNGSDTFVISGNDTILQRQVACSSRAAIYNEADDGAVDHLVIPGVALRELRLERVGEDLHLSTPECEDLVVILGWGRGASFRHLELSLDRASFDLEELMGE